MKVNFVRSGILAIFLVIALFVFPAQPALAQGTTITWDGSSSTAWGTADNWTPAQVPTSVDNVVIGNFVPGNQPTLSANTTINSLTINGRSATFSTRGGCLTINTGVTLTINGNLAINGSTGGTIGVTCSSDNRTGIIATGTAGLNVGGNVTLTNATGGPREEPIIVMGSGTFNVAGNWTRGSASTFTAGTSTVVFNGTTQAIGGSATTFNTLTIANGSTITANTAPTVTTFNINNGGRYIQTTNSGIVPGTTRNFGVSSTYEWRTGGGATFPSASGISFGNLVINTTAGNNSAAGNLTTVNGNLQIVNTTGGSYRLAATTNPTVTIAGNLIIDAGTLNFSTGTGAPTVNVAGNVQLNGGILQPATSTGVPVFNVAGNWTNNGGTFTPGTSTVVFNGGGTSTLSRTTGVGLVETFCNLTINAGTLLNTTDDYVAVSGVGGCGALTVNGQLRRQAQAQNVTGAGTWNFNDAWNLNAARLTRTSTGNNDLGSSTTVTITSNLLPTTCGSVTLGGSPVLRLYDIQPSNAGPYNQYTLRLYYRTSNPNESNGNTIDNLAIYHCNGTTWTRLPGTGGSDANGSYVEVTGVNTFSPFGIGGGPGAPTAVTLSTFSARPDFSINYTIPVFIFSLLFLMAAGAYMLWRI